MLQRFLFAILALLTLSCSVGPQNGFAGLSHPLVAVHKGDISFAPGNSLPGIKHALQSGADFVEIDVRASLDGELFLFHDSKLHVGNFIGEKKFEGGKIKELNSFEIEKLKIPSLPPATLPKLGAALDLLQGQRACLLLDVKNISPSVIENIVQSAKSREVLQQIIVQIYDLKLLKQIRSAFPSLKVLARVYKIDDLDFALSFHPEIVQIDADKLRAEFSRRVHSNGGKVLVKTVDQDDTVSHWIALRKLGADIILTDKFAQFTQTK